MKAIIVCILSCLSVFGADTNDIRVITTTITNIQPNYLETVDVFTRGGQTNLIRRTDTKDGVLTGRSQTFYHNGSEMGQYVYTGSEFIIASVPGAPYSLIFRSDSSNKQRSAIIGTTNAVILDSFACTNGVFYPKDSSFIREANSLPRPSFPR
jgi:hypothetical protein